MGEHAGLYFEAFNRLQKYQSWSWLINYSLLAGFEASWQHKSHNRECVFRGISKSCVCQQQPSCGEALVFGVPRAPGEKTAICQMKDFGCGLTGNIRVLVRSTRVSEMLPSGRQRPKRVLKVKIHGRNTCRFYRTDSKWGGEESFSSNQAVVGFT